MGSDLCYNLEKTVGLEKEAEETFLSLLLNKAIVR